MKSVTLILFILVCFAFALGLTKIFVKSSPEIKQGVLSKLQSTGKKNFNISEFQAQHAIIYSALHFLTIIIVSFSAWLLSKGLLIPVVCAIALYLLPSKWLARQERKRLELIESELPDALLFIASALRAGSSLSVALEVLVRDQRGPLGQEFSIVLKEQRLGVSFDEAIQKMSARLAIPDFVLVVVALRVSKQVGGNLSEPLQILATTLRRKAILEGRIVALTAQGKIQGLVMTMFPFLMLGVLYFLQPTMKLLFTTTVGNVVMAISCVMLYLGYAMIKKIVAIDI